MVISCASLVAIASTNQQEKHEQIALRHVLYEQYQDQHRQAYLTAEYYKVRGTANESVLLTQAAATLELGFLDHGRELIAGLEASSLLPENQSRLRLYLARDAYRRRDWPLLAEHLEQLAVEPSKPELVQSYEHYLTAELARQQLQLGIAAQHLAALDNDFPPRVHGQFNLAVSLLAMDKSGQALQLLQTITAQPPRDFAHLMMIERARVAAAEIYIERGEPELARQSLAKVSVNHQYGPHALAQIARLDMQAKRYSGAAKVWQYLVQEYPWHRAATHGISGLGFAMQETYGVEAAYAVYSEGLAGIAAQKQQLRDVRASLQQALQASAALSDQDHALLLDISAALGHDDWLSWFASAEVRQQANCWQALDQAFAKLSQDQDRLASLQAVDAEQQRRITRANQILEVGALGKRLQHLQQYWRAKQQSLATRRLTYLDVMNAPADFVSSSQLSLLHELAALEARLPTGLADRTKSLQQRIERLRGMLLFGVYRDLPAQKQQWLETLDQKLAIATGIEARIERLQQAALHHPQSVSARITRLADRHRQLTTATQVALREARGEFLAALDGYIEVDEALLIAQENGLRYDLTRLIDQRLAGGEGE
ncbi:MAG: hypothetical protein ACE37D_09030 [Pseudomonadales bacterium]